MSWIISVPVWGMPYVRTFVEAAAPALLAAVRCLREPAKFIVHTDSPHEIGAALPGQDIKFCPVPGRPTYVALQEGHADAVRAARAGDCVVLLNADLVVSGNLLARCAEHFAAGSQAVVLIGIRTVADPASRPPVDAAPRDLLAWAWGHRHQIIRDLEWPHGRSMLPTNLFWEAGQSVVARGFHQHPVAIIKHDGIKFRSTIDGDLLDYFPREGVHVVVDPDDLAMCEVSAPERRFPVRGQHQTPETVAAAMRSRASATHLWLFEHRVVVCGDGSEVAGDEAVAAKILRLLGGASTFGGQRPPPAAPAPQVIVAGPAPQAVVVDSPARTPTVRLTGAAARAATRAAVRAARRVVVARGPRHV